MGYKSSYTLTYKEDMKHIGQERDVTVWRYGVSSH